MRAILASVLLIGCGPTATHPFPEGFVWGSATAGFQVEMGCPGIDCVDPDSDWYQWVTDPAIVGDDDLHVAGDPVTLGPGMWETHAADARRMADDGLTGFRMSLEWSRLFPTASAADATTVEELAAHADPEAVAGYHAWLDALHDQGIEPFVTLNHYTLPLWVHDGVACHDDWRACEASGWVDGERIVPLIALYAGFCAMEFGDDVDRWATLNEPFATSLSGYLQPGEMRSAPPGVSDPEATVLTLRHQIEGSAAMYDAVHAHDAGDADGDGTNARVGVVLNMVAPVPADPERPEDVEAVEHLDWLYHRQFLDGLTDGSWDADLDGTWDTTRDDLAGRLDFIGINYYNRVVVQGLGFSPYEAIPLADFYPEVTWEPYPEGLADVVERADTYGLPLVISENGTPHVDRAPDLLDAHLLHLHDAIGRGADVRGYYYWSWVDNYEWNHGMAMRFGLYELDLDSKERRPRPVLERYRRIAAAGGVIAE